MKPLSADLLFTRAPTLMPKAVHLRVRELLPGIEMTSPTAESPAAFFHSDPGASQLRTAFIVSDQPPPPSSYAEALLHETEWLGAMEVAKKVRSVVTLAELHGDGLDDAARLERFAKVVAGCARALSAEAVFWKTSQKLLSPEAVERLVHDAEARRALA
jgi:hypothetical protein